MGALEELGITRDDITTLSTAVDQVNRNHRQFVSFSGFIKAGADKLIEEHADIVQNIVELGK